MLLIISHLLVLLNFFSHFLLYSHSCQWSVGTVKHVQSPSPAFTTSPADSKMPLLIFQNLWALKTLHFQSILCKNPALTQHFWCYYKLPELTQSKHQKQTSNSWLDLSIKDIFIIDSVQIDIQYFMCTEITPFVVPGFTHCNTEEGY